MRLIAVYDGIYKIGVDELYELLRERTEQQSISHKKMPTYQEHCRFVDSKPYKDWFLIEDHGEAVGAIYLTHQNEIGVFIFKKYQGKGYGPLAIHMLMCRFPGERFLANINPNNAASIKCFTQLGFKLIQQTYELEEQP